MHASPTKAPLDLMAARHEAALVKATWIGIAVFAVLACGSSSDDQDAGAEDAKPIEPAGCAGLLSSYDLSGATYTGYAHPRDAGDPDSPMVYGLTAILDQGPPPDVFEIQIWDGFGVFGDGVAPGEIPITGAEANLNDCGLCALVFGDLSGGSTSTVLMAQSGTFTIDDLSLEVGSRFRGSAAEVQYSLINSSGPVPDGCTLAVTNIAFDVMLQSQ